MDAEYLSNTFILFLTYPIFILFLTCPRFASLMDMFDTDFLSDGEDMRPIDCLWDIE
jgi:hypothetical protein